MEPIKIVIVDDHKIIRDGIRSLLLGNSEIQIIGEASHGYLLFDLLKKICPDIILMDISMPRISGIEVTRIVKKDHPEIKILILTANTDEQTLISSVKAGASGFLSKDISKEELSEAILTVKAGSPYYGKTISGLVQKALLENYELKSESVSEQISDREIEIIRLFAEGLSYKQIAERLYISARTVETHKNNIMKKLGLATTVDLVKYAIKNGLTDV